MKLFDAVQILGMRWPKSGKLNCPKHNDKTPSLQLYANTDSWYCFSCGATGDAIGLMAIFTGKDMRSLLREYGDNSPQKAKRETIALVGPQAMLKQVERKFAQAGDRIWPRVHEVFGQYQTDVLVDEIVRVSEDFDNLVAWANNQWGEDDVLYGLKEEAGDPPPVREVLAALADFEAGVMAYLDKREQQLEHPGRYQEEGTE